MPDARVVWLVLSISALGGPCGYLVALDRAVAEPVRPSDRSQPAAPARTCGKTRCRPISARCRAHGPTPPSAPTNQNPRTRPSRGPRPSISRKAFARSPSLQASRRSPAQDRLSPPARESGGCQQVATHHRPPDRGSRRLGAQPGDRAIEEPDQARRHGVGGNRRHDPGRPPRPRSRPMATAPTATTTNTSTIPRPTAP